MPSVSPAQKHLMDAAAHGWHMPGGGGPSLSVAKEFVAADKARGRAMGGVAPNMMPPQTPIGSNPAIAPMTSPMMMPAGATFYGTTGGGISMLMTGAYKA